MDESASRFRRSSNWPCRENFSCWYSGVDDSLWNSRATHPDSPPCGAPLSPLPMSLLSEQAEAALALFGGHAGQALRQARKLPAQMTARRQQLAFAERVVKRVVIVGQHGVDGQSENSLQFLGSDIRSLRRTIQNDVQPVSEARVD